jgi:hypothetical protein
MNVSATVYYEKQPIAQFQFVADAIRCFPSINCWVGVTHILVPLDAWQKYLICDPKASYEANFTATALCLFVTLKPKEILCNPKK